MHDAHTSLHCLAQVSSPVSWRGVAVRAAAPPQRGPTTTASRRRASRTGAWRSFSDLFGETWQLRHLTSQLKLVNMEYTPHNSAVDFGNPYTAGIRVRTPTGALVSVQTGPAAGTEFAETMVLEHSDGTFCEDSRDWDDVRRWESPQELLDALVGDVPVGNSTGVAPAGGSAEDAPAGGSAGDAPESGSAGDTPAGGSAP